MTDRVKILRPASDGMVMGSQDNRIAGVVIADATVPGCPMTYVSPGFEQLTGYVAAEVLGSLMQPAAGSGDRPALGRRAPSGHLCADVRPMSRS